MSTLATIFPLQAKGYVIPVIFRDTSGNLLTSITGAASAITIDGAAVVAGATPVEVGTSGLCYLTLTGAQMNGQLIIVKCTCSNANQVASVYAIYTYPAWSVSTGAPAQPGSSPPANTVRPTDFLGRMMWIFSHLYCLHTFSRSTGIETVYDDAGNILTSGQTNGNDVNYEKFPPTP